MDWRSALTDNWPYKVASLVLAVLLWLNVTAEEGGEFSLPTEVRVEVADSGWVAVSVEPGTVETVFRGRRGIFFPGELPVVRHVIETVTAPRMRLDLTPRMVSGIDGDVNLNPVALRPQTVEVELEPLVTRKVAVAPRLELSAADGYSLVPPVLMQPESVTVRGPESAVSSLDSVETERAALEDLQRTVTRELQLELPPGLEQVSWSPTTILATVEVDSTSRRSFVLPLALGGDAGSEVVAGIDSVRVTVSGAAALVRNLSVESVRALLVVDSVPPGELSVPVEVELPAESPLRGAAEPSRVTVRPSGRAPGAGEGGR